MPSQTSPKNLPWPLGTDRVMDGDDAIRRLAQSVDNMAQSGSGTVNVATGGAASSQAVTFPVAYASTPFVCITDQGTANTNQKAGHAGATTTGFTVSAIRASAGPVGFQWIAVGPVVAVA